jgi:hypothetical protein
MYRASQGNARAGLGLGAGARRAKTDHITGDFHRRHHSSARLGLDVHVVHHRIVTTHTPRREICMDDQDNKIIEAVKSIAEALRADVMESIGKLSERCDAIEKKADALKKKDEADKRSGENEDDLTRGNMATRVAADSDSVDRGAIAALRAEVTAMKKTRPSTDLNKLADIQVKADAVLRTHNEAADAPMAGEDVVSYNIRMARKMQPHSARWKGVDLHLIKGRPASAGEHHHGDPC